jgi:uncharacterized glyoxalase superfamily protein PhnB
MSTQYEQSAKSSNRSMPSSVIIPELAYPDVRAAVDWLCRTFGFVERLRIGNHRAQLIFGAGTVIVTKGPGNANVGSSDGDLNHAIMVRITDIDRHYEHAKQAGAQIVSPPTDYPYGERQYVVTDPGDHRWTFSQTIADIDPKDWGGTLFE